MMDTYVIPIGWWPLIEEAMASGKMPENEVRMYKQAYADWKRREAERLAPDYAVIEAIKRAMEDAGR